MYVLCARFKTKLQPWSLHQMVTVIAGSFLHLTIILALQQLHVASRIYRYSIFLTRLFAWHLAWQRTSCDHAAASRWFHMSFDCFFIGIGQVKCNKRSCPHSRSRRKTNLCTTLLCTLHHVAMYTVGYQSLGVHWCSRGRDPLPDWMLWVTFVQAFGWWLLGVPMVCKLQWIFWAKLNLMERWFS